VIALTERLDLHEPFRAGDLVQTRSEPRRVYKILFVQRDRARCRYQNPEQPGVMYRPEYVALRDLLAHPRTL